MKEKFWCCGGQRWFDEEPVECDGMNCEECEYYNDGDTNER